MNLRKLEKAVLCFGEVLWDSLPAGLFVGGAPLNVAIHLSNFNHYVLPVSAVGDDFLGRELLRRLKEREIDTDFVFKSLTEPTGVMQVELDEDGNPAFQIAERGAWSKIPFTESLLEIAAKCKAVVFGSMALESEFNRETLDQILGQAVNSAKFYDVNLRPPYEVEQIFAVWRYASQAKLVKLSNSELFQILEIDEDEMTIEEAARAFQEKANCEQICVTAGMIGAGLLADNEWHWIDVEKAEVKDTVGAGDAFFANLISGVLNGKTSIQETLLQSRELSSRVVSFDGATPF